MITPRFPHYVRCSLLASFVALAFSTGTVRAEVVTFEDDVLPVFRDHCLSCHNTEKKRADIDLSVYSALIAADIVAPDDLDDSLLYQVVTHAEKPTMPPDQPRIPDEAVAKIREWIEGGLVERSGAKALAKKKSKVVGLSEVPTGRPPGPPCRPVDALLEPVLRLARPATIDALACAPWSPLVAVGARRQVLVYDTETLDLVAVLPFPEGTPHVLRFSRSGTLLVAGGGRAGHSGRVVVWDVESSRRVCEVGDELDTVMAADISPDHTEVALGGASKTVQIYSTATGEKLATVQKHADWITGIEYSPDGVLLATADRGGGLFVWESFSRQLFHDLRGHESGVTEISWRSDSNVLASGGRDGQAYLWSMNEGGVLKKWRAHGPGMTSLAYAGDGRLVTAGRDRKVKTWQGDGKAIRTFDGLGDIATRARFDESGTRVVGGDWAGRIVVWADGDATARGEIEPAPPTIAERALEAERDLAEASRRFRELDTVRARAASAEAAAHRELAVSTATRDAAAEAGSESEARLEQSRALVVAIEAAIAAAERLGADETVDVAALLATQRELLEPARGLRTLAEEHAVAARERVAELTAALGPLTEAHQEAEIALRGAVTAAEVVKQRVRELQSRVAHWEAAAINVVRLQIASEAEQAEAEWGALSADRDTIAAELESAQEEGARLREQLAAVSAGRAEHEARIAERAAAVREARVELGQLQKALDARTELASAAKTLIDRVTERVETSGKSEALEEALSHARSTWEALERDRTGAQVDLEAHRERIVGDAAHHRAAQDALIAYEAEAAKLPARVDRSSEQIRSIRERLEASAEVAAAQGSRLEALRERFLQVDRRYRDLAPRSD